MHTRRRPSRISRKKFQERFSRILAITSKPVIGSRMNGMIFRSFRKRNRSQENTNTVYSESGIPIPQQSQKNAPLRQIRWCWYFYTRKVLNSVKCTVTPFFFFSPKINHSFYWFSAFCLTTKKILNVRSFNFYCHFYSNTIKFFYERRYT